MATQTKDSSPGQVVQEHIARPRFKWPLVAIATLIVILIMGSFINTSPAAEIEPADQRAFAASHDFQGGNSTAASWWIRGNSLNSSWLLG